MSLVKPIATFSFICCNKTEPFVIDNDIDLPYYVYELTIISSSFEFIWKPKINTVAELIEAKFCDCVNRVIKITINRIKALTVSECKIETFTDQGERRVRTLRKGARPFYYVFGSNITKICLLFHVTKTA